jgi:hypothetical protein
MNRVGDLRDAILASDDLAREPVDVPWEMGGEKLYIRALRASERDEYVAKTMRTGDFTWTSDLTASLLVKVIVNEDGERIFSDTDAEALGRKSASTLSKLFKVAMRLSGMDEEGAEAIKADFGPAQSGASDSG